MAAVLRLLCLWLCSEAVMSDAQWLKTKAAFRPHYESSTAHRNPHGRGWHTLSEAHKGASSRETSPRSRFNSGPLSPGHRADGPVRPSASAVELRGGGTWRQRRTAGPGSTGVASSWRQLSDLPLTLVAISEAPTEAPPEAVAQEQASNSTFGLNDSLSLDDLPDDGGTRRRRLKNPFFPLSVAACAAYAIVISAALLFAVGVLANVSVMCIVCHNYYIRSISNSLLANLALWDFVVVFFCLPLVVFHALTDDWLLGPFSCRIIPYLEVACLGVTTFTLCALCIDRFRAATSVQMSYEMMDNWVSTSAKLAVIWLGALLLALPELLIHRLIVGDAEGADTLASGRCAVSISTELPDWLYVLGLTYHGARLWWHFGCYFCLPTLFTICSSLLTARKIRQARRGAARCGKQQLELENQMNCAVVALAILYGFCIIPDSIYNVVSVYMAASVSRGALDVLQLLSQIFLFCKSAVTPALMLLLCRPFTASFLDCCCCCCRDCSPPGPHPPDAEVQDQRVTSVQLELGAVGRDWEAPSRGVGGRHG